MQIDIQKRESSETQSHLRSLFSYYLICSHLTYLILYICYSDKDRHITVTYKMPYFNPLPPWGGRLNLVKESKKHPEQEGMQGSGHIQMERQYVFVFVPYNFFHDRTDKSSFFFITNRIIY